LIKAFYFFQIDILLTVI